MVALRQSNEDRTSGHQTASLHQWGATLCLAGTEQAARQILSRALLCLGFESVAVIRQDVSGAKEVLWRSMNASELPLGESSASDDRQVGGRTNGWVLRRDGILTHEDFVHRDPRAETDLLPFPHPFGHAAWRTFAAVQHRVHGQRFRVGVASMTSFDLDHDVVEAVRFLSNLYFALQAGRWSEAADCLDEPPALTAVQLDCLRWAAAGKTYQDIADILEINPRTVRFHLQNARARYGFATVTQTVVQAAKHYDFDPLGRCNP